MFEPNISKEDLIRLPLHHFQGAIHIVDSYQQAEECARELIQFPVLGFDTETRPSFTKGRSNSVSLLQLANETDAWLFRLQQTLIPPALVRLLSSADVLKIGSSPKQDVAALRKITAFEPQGFIDLQEFVNQFGIADNALAKMTAIVLQFRISKAQQLSNWEAPVLKTPQLDYAATDAWVCYEIYKKLTAI